VAGGVSQGAGMNGRCHGNTPPAWMSLLWRRSSTRPPSRFSVHRTARTAREGRAEQRAADGYLKGLSLAEQERGGSTPRSSISGLIRGRWPRRSKSASRFPSRRPWRTRQWQRHSRLPSRPTPSGRAIPHGARRRTLSVTTSNGSSTGWPSNWPARFRHRSSGHMPFVGSRHHSSAAAELVAISFTGSSMSASGSSTVTPIGTAWSSVCARPPRATWRRRARPRQPRRFS
jgi:hypothetical protein